MTAFDKAWKLVKGLEPVEERTEDKLDQVLEEVRNRPPKEGIELPGLVRTGSLEDRVPNNECAGCGLPHGGQSFGMGGRLHGKPSKYCSEICESQGSYEDR